jgi:hypothetical protein
VGEGAAFAPDNPALKGYVVLDWTAFDQWQEEDEVVMGHPHDPFGRIDVLHSSRRVVVSADGIVLAESTRPTLLFETSLPTDPLLPATGRHQLGSVEAFRGPKRLRLQGCRKARVCPPP